MTTIYHNSRCGKSRTALKALEEAGIDVEVVEYLKAPPTADKIRTLLRKLNIKPLELIRTKEAVFREHFAGKPLSDEEYIQAMVDYPILIERPVVIIGDTAWIARDAETLEAIAKRLGG
ncbi:MAG: arsenate reductase (glutaredoxin) [Bacteroidetes bacterium]|nr:MAG: arsenate reductase (glutaredoxin) [Bacteroidota bacterium]